MIVWNLKAKFNFKSDSFNHNIVHSDVEDSIAQDWYDKTFEELEIGDGDTLYFSKNKKVDG